MRLCGRVGPILALVVTAALALPSSAAASFPGLNGSIAFDTNRDGNYQVYSQSPSGTPTRLTTNATNDLTPRWSPDGSKVVFSTNRDGNDQIYVMNANGGGQTRLTSNAANDVQPTWSPDGSKIAFVSDRDGNLEIYSMSANGSGQTRLTNNPATDEEPSWSPDGSKIAFTTNRDGNFQIYAMNADGSSPTRLTNNAALDEWPDWSPDGSKIAFDTNRDGNYQVYSMNASGSAPTRLTNNAAADSRPSWSPDGSKIAFQSDRDGNKEIYFMDAAGSGQTRLTNSPTVDESPSWQPIPSAYLTIGVVSSIGFDPAPPGGAIGDTVTFTYTITNFGPSAARAVTAEADFDSPRIYALAASTGGCTTTAPKVTCSLGTLAKGANASFSVSARLNAVGHVAVGATVTSATGCQCVPGHFQASAPVAGPSISKLKLRRKTHRAHGKRRVVTTVTYVATRRWGTVLSIQRCVRRKRGARGRCRYRTVARVVHRDRRGTNRIRLKALPPGRYRLVAVPHYGSAAGPALKTAFRV